MLQQPVVVGFYAPDDGLFEFYNGGIWMRNRCNYTYGPGGVPIDAQVKINHALLVVGFNAQAQPPYWIVKNSWGSGVEWGDSGSALLEMTEENTYGTCFMYSFMIAPTPIVPTGRGPGVLEPAKREWLARLLQRTLSDR